MAAYNTVQDLLDALTAVSNVDAAVSDRLVSDPEGFGWDLQLIKYQRSYSNSTIRIIENWVLVKSDGTVWWWSGKREGVAGGIPTPLQPSQRAPYLSKQNYINQIESNFADWTVLSLGITIQGGFDVLNVTASNETSDRVIGRTIVVWKDSSNTTRWKLREQ